MKIIMEIITNYPIISIVIGVWLIGLVWFVIEICNSPSMPDDWE